MHKIQMFNTERLRITTDLHTQGQLQNISNKLIFESAQWPTNPNLRSDYQEKHESENDMAPR